MKKLPTLLLGCFLLIPAIASSQNQPSPWKTNLEKRSIDLKELESGGPPKDGIPSLDRPNFVSTGAASKWVKPQEPVLSLVVGKEAKAYPLQILIWHEIANDRIGQIPVAVTFCPLCYSAIVFDRRVGGTVTEFGVSGMLRHSDMVMYDRNTESLWQQMTGEAIVGERTGSKLKQVPAQIISFAQFRAAHPEGKVLSRKTGHSRPYGNNPYLGYDDINKTPFRYRGKIDKRLPPMEKVVTVSFQGQHKAYPYSLTRKKKVIQDKVGGQALVLFHGACEYFSYNIEFYF